MNVILLGPPGAGKGTQAEKMSERYGIEHISTGDMFRAALAAGTPMGLEAKKYMDSGELVPDEVVEGVVFERLEKGLGGGFLLDGFPRNIHQAEALDRYLSGHGSAIDAVLNIEVDPEVLVRRISGRRVCRECGSIAHVDNNPPEREGVCDECGGELYQRDDDKSETVRNRLEVYRRQTEPLIDYYRPTGKLVDIEGEKTPDEVFREIVNELGRLEVGGG